MKWWRRIGWGLIVVGITALILIWWFNNKKEEKEREQQRIEENRILLKFAVAADIHDDLDNLKKVIDRVKVDDVGFLIIAGDLTTNGLENELAAVKKTLDESGLRYYAVPGNHDGWAERRLKTDIYGKIFNQRYQTFKEGGVKFILADNGDWRGLGEAQKAWLHNETGECRVVRCLVVMHMPLNNLWSTHIMGEEDPLVAEEAKEVAGWLVEDRIEQLFSGHLHYGEKYEIGGLRTQIVGAVARARSRKQEFVEVEVKSKLIETRVVVIE